jgi:CheY-like chemotaxis protein/anti-sigma regulatory factor (Ser/Thr protein kinase)
MRNGSTRASRLLAVALCGNVGSVRRSGTLAMPSQKRILLVDDDPAIHRLLAMVLESPEWQIESAHDGEAALACVKAEPYDLVLTDVRMPGMDGLELLRRIRQERPQTKVLVMTGAHTPGNVIESIREQAFGYLSKPFSPSVVVEMITEALKTPDWEDEIEVLSARPNWIALKVRCRVETADRLVHFLTEMKMDLPARDREDVATAFREMLRNAIEHGGGLDPNKKVHVAYIRTKQAIVYYIRDPGKGFSFDDLAHAAVSNPPENPIDHITHRAERGLRPGGFGILLVQNLVDELIYNEKGNEVLLIKYL